MTCPSGIPWPVAWRSAGRRFGCSRPAWENCKPGLDLSRRDSEPFPPGHFWLSRNFFVQLLHQRYRLSLGSAHCPGHCEVEVRLPECCRSWEIRCPLRGHLHFWSPAVALLCGEAKGKMTSFLLKCFRVAFYRFNEPQLDSSHSIPDIWVGTFQEVLSV